MKAVLISLLLCVLITIGLVISVFFFKKNPSQKIQSSTPVTSINGKVEKIDNDNIVVSVKGAKPQNISYKIKADLNTQIIIPPPFYTNYLFAIPKPFSPLSNLSDLKVGQTVLINSNTDLRTLSSNEFTAVSISQIPPPNIINGSIVSIENNLLHIKGFPQLNATDMAEQQIEKEYIVHLTGDTEISGFEQVDQKAIRYSASDLKVNTQIAVYTNNDVTSVQEVTALRIQPLQLSLNVSGTPTIASGSSSLLILPPSSISSTPSSNINTPSTISQ